MKRKTVSRVLTYKGIGLHKGEDIILKLKPATVNTGIIFKRVDLEEGKNIIKLDINNVFDLTRGTNVRNGYGSSIYTIEHFLSALYIMGVTDLFVEVDGNEMPIIDGSSKKYISMLKNNIHEFEENVDDLVIKTPVFVTKGDKHVIGLPYDGYKITYSVNYNHSFLKSQLYESEINVENFEKEISSARTFGFDYEIEYLKANNLALGGSLDNAIIITKNGVMNPGGLRFEDEFVRHKVLDLIGDLKIINKPIKGHIIAIKAGHAINNDFANELMKKFYNKETK